MSAGPANQPFAEPLAWGLAPWEVVEADLSIVRSHLETGGDAGAKDEEGRSLLWLAVENGKHSLAKLLIEHHAPLDAVDHLGDTPLMMAASWNDLPMMKLLLEAGANADFVSARGGCALNNSLAKKSVDGVRLVLSKLGPAPAQGDGHPPWWAKTTQKRMLGVLWKHGISMTQQDNHGTSLLHHLAAANKAHVAEWTKVGLSLDLQDHQGETALMTAARGGCMKACRALLAAGADVLLVNHEGRSAWSLVGDSPHDDSSDNDKAKVRDLLARARQQALTRVAVHKPATHRRKPL
jgi:ankyrin repeat protein